MVKKISGMSKFTILKRPHEGQSGCTSPPGFHKKSHKNLNHVIKNFSLARLGFAPDNDLWVIGPDILAIRDSDKILV